jgi:hypothetical protein
VAILALAAAVFGALAGGPATAQTAPPSAANWKKVPVSLPHLYWHFFNVQNHLDDLAAQREQQGRDGSNLRKHFQQKLGFTDAQFALVRSAAQRLRGELNALDAQAKAIIDADRAANPIQPGDPPTWRPPPPELMDLQHQHEDTIQSEVSNLKSALGSDLAVRLDAFLQSRAAAKPAAPPSHPRPTPEEIRREVLQAIQKNKGVQP